MGREQKPDPCDDVPDVSELAEGDPLAALRVLVEGTPPECVYGKASNELLMLVARAVLDLDERTGHVQRGPSVRTVVMDHEPSWYVDETGS